MARVIGRRNQDRTRRRGGQLITMSVLMEGVPSGATYPWTFDQTFGSE